MEFLGQSPSLERRKAMRYGDGYGRYVTDWGRRIPSLGACKETGDYCRCELPGVCAVSDLARCGRTDGRPDL